MEKDVIINSVVFSRQHMEHILLELGLDKDQARIYLHLLEARPMSAGNMAKILGIKRTTLYGILQKLLEKGVISESQNSGVAVFSAQPPEKIGLLLDQRLEDIQNRKKEFQKVLPQLRNSPALSYLNPTFKIVKGEEGMRQILKDMLLYENMETQSFWPIKAMVDILSPEFFRSLNKVRIQNNLYTRAIWPLEQIIDIKKHPYLGSGEGFKREIRIAPKGIDCSMGYWIYGNKVVFISSRQEQVGFTVESKELAELLLTQFEFLWQLSKPVIIDADGTDAFLKEIGRLPKQER